MTLKKAIEVLNTFQRWRLGDEDIDMQKPSVVTEAINTLLDFTDSPEFFAVKSMVEISNEEIRKASIEYYESPIGNIDREIGFIYGCKWYREKLKINK